MLEERLAHWILRDALDTYLKDDFSLMEDKTTVKNLVTAEISYNSLGANSTEGSSWSFNVHFSRRAKWHSLERTKNYFLGGTCWYPITLGWPDPSWYGNCVAI